MKMKRNIPGLAAALMLAAKPAMADPNDMGWGYGHMMFGGLAMILFWGGLIVAIVLAVRYLGMSGGGEVRGRDDRRDPLDILRERFARGEIDEEEYRRRRQGLEER